MEYGPNATLLPSTFSGWKRMLDTPVSHIHITAFYWSLRAKEMVADPTDWQGAEIFNMLETVGQGGKIKIVQNCGNEKEMEESKLFEKQGLAEVRSINFSRWFGSGVLHTKLWIVDSSHVYVGSANMDWRSLTQVNPQKMFVNFYFYKRTVKELGIVFGNCSCVANDVEKIFSTYWFMGAQGAEIPGKWPKEFSTEFNSRNPMKIEFNGIQSKVYFTNSPSPFCSRGREEDLAAILHIISTATKFVHIAVMDYLPITLYSSQSRYWPVIDDALRSAAYENGVAVRLMVSHWNHSHEQMLPFLRSLSSFAASLNRGSLEIKLFCVPAYNERQGRIPYARVNHNKYMVTEQTAYIGTSNWVGDYFIDTAGVGAVIQQNERDIEQVEQSIVSQLQRIFMRDWNSPFTTNL